MQLYHYKSETKAYSELIRQEYKPKVSKKKQKEMAALKAKTHENRRRVQEGQIVAKSPSPNQLVKGMKLGPDFLNALKRGGRASVDVTL